MIGGFVYCFSRVRHFVPASPTSRLSVLFVKLFVVLVLFLSMLRSGVHMPFLFCFFLFGTMRSGEDAMMMSYIPKLPFPLPLVGHVLSCDRENGTTSFTVRTLRTVRNHSSEGPSPHRVGELSITNHHLHLLKDRVL